MTIVHGDENDWVDKKGAFAISDKYPNKIKLVILKDMTHNIPLQKIECIKFL